VLVLKALYVNYAWNAYSSWNDGWSSIIAKNRGLVRSHIEANSDWPDALDVVRKP